MLCRFPAEASFIPISTADIRRLIQIETARKSAREISGRFSMFELTSRGYGLVVVVVVVSSRLITAAGCANTTLRTTTRSPTVE